MIRVGILFHSQHFQSSALSAPLRFKISSEPVNAETLRNAESARARIRGGLVLELIRFSTIRRSLDRSQGAVDFLGSVVVHATDADHSFGVRAQCRG